MRKVVSGFWALLLTVSLAVTALGAEPSVSVEKRFTFAPGSVYSPTDLFPDFKNVLPGDSLEESISVKNGHDRKLRLYLRADPPQQDTAFLEQLTLDITCGGRTVFSGSAGEAFRRTELAVLAPGEEATLRVALTVPLELSDLYVKTRGDVIWVFSAEEVPGDSLIQTGQVLWPVYLMAGFGVFCLVLGGVLLKKRHG